VHDLTVGIDIGTTSTKAVAVDGDGAIVARDRRHHGVLAGHERLEHDAERAWHRDVVDAYHEVAAAGSVAGVAVAAMVPSLTAVDAAGRPCGPGLLYGDARGGGRPGESPATSGEALGFLRWLAGESPEAGGFWPAQAVANHALGGRAAVDYATAFCLAPLFEGAGWSTAVVEEAGAGVGQLPEVVAGWEPISRVGGRRGHGGRDGPALGAGTVDALAAQLVAGADEPGDVLVILGATLIVWMVVPSWMERSGLWTVPQMTSDRCLVGGASNAGGLFVDWALGLVGAAGPAGNGAAGDGAAGDGESPDGRANHRPQVDPDDVPLWLPYARGERTPLHRPDLRAELSGLHLGHGPDAVRRATYEASGYVVRRLLDLAGGLPGATGEAATGVAAARGASAGSPAATGVAAARGASAGTTVASESGMPPGATGVAAAGGLSAGSTVASGSGMLPGEAPAIARRIVAVGGGTRVGPWVQALADVTGLPVDVGEADATALGTAFLARCAAGLETDLADARRWARVLHRVQPDPAWTRACDQRYQQFVARTAAAAGEAGKAVDDVGR
jgi:xylulokinase